MRLLWTVLKVALALCFVIPVGIIVLAITLGILGALLGIAIFALKIAVVGLIAWGVLKLIVSLVRGPKPRSQPDEVRSLPAPDPYYEAAMRELDRDMGSASR